MKKLALLVLIVAGFVGLGLVASCSATGKSEGKAAGSIYIDSPWSDSRPSLNTSGG